MKNRMMANKGQGFELEIEHANQNYKDRGIAMVQQIPTPWTVQRAGDKIISAFPTKKSTVDFRGTLRGGRAIGFDCKESESEKGLPLSHIQPHQVEYIRDALGFNELAFILCHMKRLDKRFRIPGAIVLEYWDFWQQNKGLRNINFIATEDMTEIKPCKGVILDYLALS